MTKFTSVHEKRLLKLAAFLRERVPRKKFDFNHIMREGANPPQVAILKTEDCGTTGCAVGWMPVCFPRDFAWNPWVGNQLEVVNKKTHKDDLDAAQEWFGLTLNETMYLFYPEGYYEVYDSDGVLFKQIHNNLGEDATPKQVARHIERFVKAKKAGKFG